ncbi:sensor histidine kinase [Actinoplanes couchii]|uniref:histidine kinase n=1 Tax=Actinoplanes couchii TaxID=403638 RepID=A0ABQ3XL89_9ACTN|nr:histidine kinase [Actinoplanes couchii]GID59275.1 two-component sensor histidine kinase [Actinoplanes couchii]
MSTPAAEVHRRLTRLSLLIAAVCAVTDVLVYLGDGRPASVVAWVVLAAIVAADAAVAAPTRWSLAVLIAAVAVNAGGAALLHGDMTLSLNEAGLLVASYRAGAWLHGRPAAVALVTIVGGLIVSHHARGFPFDWTVVVSSVKFGFVTWLVGRYTTAWRSYLDELQRQADEADRDAREAIDRAVAEDRAAIAHDLHDVITHHVSAISVHAGAARLRLTGTTSDQAAIASLRSVEDSSRSALGDLRHMLDVLHGQSPAAGERPGLARIDTLLDGMRAADIEVRLQVTGIPARLPEPLDAALYRIVQEMLTNALRHGDGGPVDVAVRHGDGVIEVETRNPYDEPTRTSRTSRGLDGITNRAAAFGGRARSGPVPGSRTWSTAVTFDWERS